MPSPFVRSAVLALTAAVIGCATHEVAPPQSVESRVGPVLVVEQFMRAVNANDLETMAQLFGTKDGSVLRLDPRRQVEERMFAIASILRHEDYSFTGEQIVPGRLDEAIQLLVRVETKNGGAVVPFTMVLAANRNWLIEQIGIERLTNLR